MTGLNLNDDDRGRKLLPSAGNFGLIPGLSECIQVIKLLP